MNGNRKQTVSREEYRRLDNRVTCILQQRWPVNEISLWVGRLKGKQQAMACAILRRSHIVEGLTPVAIDQNGTIRCAVTGRTLFIALCSPIDRTNPSAAEQLNPTYRPAQHQIVADQRQIEM